MRPRAMLRATAVTVGLATLVIGGSAIAQMSADSVIEARKKHMKEQGAAWKSIQDNAKAGQIVAIAPEADKLAKGAPKIPEMFPEGTLHPEKSAAKPEIWQKRAEFDAAAKNLETWSLKLRDAAQANKTDETQAIVKDFGRQACGTCHQPFRVPPKQ